MLGVCDALLPAGPVSWLNAAVIWSIRATKAAICVAFALHSVSHGAGAGGAIGLVGSGRVLFPPFVMLTLLIGLRFSGSLGLAVFSGFRCSLGLLIVAEGWVNNDRL